MHTTAAPQITKPQRLIEHAAHLSEKYDKDHCLEDRKLKGQFFTPRKVSAYMAGLFDITGQSIRLLDPGAGTGNLTAAFCERVLEAKDHVHLTVDVYENDPTLVPLLRDTLETCMSKLDAAGHRMDYRIYEQDFILVNDSYFARTDLLSTSLKPEMYDYVISNPPYYKLNKDSPESSVMVELVAGQPNIYPLFMALAVSMMKQNGEMVFITPRSFCSGLYYKKFRDWFLSHAQIKNIHIFESRKEVFDRDDVLQETIIVKAIKNQESPQGHICISESKNRSFEQTRELEINQSDLIFRRNGDSFIRIPTSANELSILRAIDKWPNNLKHLGMEISTGPVVPFRAEQYLLTDLKDAPVAAPLLWMHNIQGMQITWPLKKTGKAAAISVQLETVPILVPVKNYTLVKRFTAKEQKRRLHAAALLEKEFPYDSVGIENHLNYIYRPKGNLSINETVGMAALLNLKVIDDYFRALNGNTQVNATDIRSLPLPDIEIIRKIGHLVTAIKPGHTEDEMERDIYQLLGIDSTIRGNIDYE
jgi:adenine-specific DNA-methyltransferase